jgi:large subunit ribosomal protein L32
MAAPKKRTSKTRKNLRKAQWKAQASVAAKKAFATAKMVLKSLANTQEGKSVTNTDFNDSPTEQA